MTAVFYPALRCDGPGCDAETHHPFAATVGDVRQLRREEGWHVRPGGRDLCPDCWAAGHR